VTKETQTWITFAHSPLARSGHVAYCSCKGGWEMQSSFVPWKKKWIVNPELCACHRDAEACSMVSSLPAPEWPKEGGREVASYERPSPASAKSEPWPSTPFSTRRDTKLLTSLCLFHADILGTRGPALHKLQAQMYHARNRAAASRLMTSAALSALAKSGPECPIHPISTCLPKF
jgi:hypothetical protein